MKFFSKMTALLALALSVTALAMPPGGPGFGPGDRHDRDHGGGHWRPEPPRPPVYARACFFQHINYGGASFCMNVGEVNANLVPMGWNDQISSISIEGPAAAVVFQDINFRGMSQTVTQNMPDIRVLGGFWNDFISSIQVINYQYYPQPQPYPQPMPQPPPPPPMRGEFQCLVVDGKSHAYLGAGNSEAEGKFRALSQCTLCNSYAKMVEPTCQFAQPWAPKVHCSIVDGKGHTYWGEGRTQQEALVSPYNQCGDYCWKYPYTKSCM